jgi:uncharacterized protein YwgA
MLTKHDWVLLVLRHAPLDRVHLMKALFLLWYRTRNSDQPIADYFTFEPYFYGPYSLGVYAELRALSEEDLVVQPAQKRQEWAHYYLSERGKDAAERIAAKASPEQLKLVEQIAQEVANLEFRDLLRKVYSEAPEFATESLMKGVLNS